MNRREFIKQTAAIGVTAGASVYVAGLSDPARSATKRPLRPPGSLDEEAFASTCIRCLRCVDACPNRALVSLENGGIAGTPTLHPRKASCMLCANMEGEYLKCTEACPSGALQLVRKDREEIKEKVRIGLAQIDLDLCYSYNSWSCGACYAACPLAGDAMTIGNWERPVVNDDACVGCGCCERSCIRYPHAIRVQARVT